MKIKFAKYWMISYLSNCIPVILDPRFKFRFVDFRLKQAFGDNASVHIAKVDRAIRSLFNGYSSETGESLQSSTQGNGTASSLKGHWADWSTHVSAESNQVTGNSTDIFMMIYFHVTMTASISCTGGRCTQQSTRL